MVPAEETDAVLGEDGLLRCPWGNGDPVLRHYHDVEWGRPIQGESAYLERLVLEAFQSGLAWITILRKRAAFREAFVGFDADRVAALGEADVDRLMGQPRIVRNRKKIEAAITNARAAITLRSTGGLPALVETFRPARPAVPPRHVGEVPAHTAESTELALALKARGFVFVGPTTAYALMQATGIVDDHLVGCHARSTEPG